MSRRPAREVSQIKRHLEQLKREPWLGTARRWWPNRLFHCTDLQNVVSILKSGELLSRTQVQAAGQLQVDIAAPAIIDQTSDKWLDFVRLYFRPRTPTQYNNEGFRPKKQWKRNAHCPIPVYLLFDAMEVLSKAECLFTDGNIAAGAVPMYSVRQLGNIPFKLVYHDTWFDPTARSTIVYHRNAEVLIPGRLDLGAVRLICCRSQAEYETLLHLLPPGTRSRWVDKIGVQPRWNLFFNKWTYVDQTEATDEQLTLKFNPEPKTTGSFDARIEFVDLMTAGPKTYSWRDEEFDVEARPALRFKLTMLESPQDYLVRFYLDDQLAFASRYQNEELPF